MPAQRKQSRTQQNQSRVEQNQNPAQQNQNVSSFTNLTCSTVTDNSSRRPSNCAIFPNLSPREAPSRISTLPSEE
jgi:hypothetical protein